MLPASSHIAIKFGEELIS